jgi:sugar lactone lactonase YvrE
VGNRSANKFELDLDEYKNVDPALIGYKEVRNYNISAGSPAAVACRGEKIYVVADNFLQTFNLEGNQLLKVTLPYEPACIDIAEDGQMVIGFSNRIGFFNENAELIWMGDTLGFRAIVTAVAVRNQLIFIADAGNRLVHRYDISGKYIDHFEGKTGEQDSIGFIVPSGYFDLKINQEGELWVVNPGRHAFENYTYEGQLRSFWENSSARIEGFSGCCNPAHIAFLPDGSFVTSEKLIVRIKIHKPSGQLSTVVASPVQFKENGIAPDLAVDDNGNIYALDYDRKILRVFAPK